MHKQNVWANDLLGRLSSLRADQGFIALSSTTPEVVLPLHIRFLSDKLSDHFFSIYEYKFGCLARFNLYSEDTTKLCIKYLKYQLTKT